MTSRLKLSLAANVALCLATVFLAVRPVRTADRELAAPANSPLPVETTVEQEPEFPTRATTPPFRWNEIESSDYRIYIANLRRIGCPEQTVRDIIVADVDSLYTVRRRQLQDQARNSTAVKWGIRDAVQTPLAGELRKLQAEETVFINSLLGLQAQAPAETQTSPTAMQSPHRQRNEARREVSLPGALRDVNPEALKLTDDQLAVLADIRESFINAIGGTNLSADDPEYRRRWQKAQPESDDMLRGMLGVQTWFDIESEASGNRNPD